MLKESEARPAAIIGFTLIITEVLVINIFPKMQEH